LRRPFSWARASCWLLALAALPLFLAFTWQPDLASVGDDSASYLVVAHWMAGGPAEIVRWTGYHTHFPPLFAAVLALVGPGNLHAAHAAVALFAAFALVPICLFAEREGGRRDAAFLLAMLFLFTPTAWVSTKGILSEPLFLLTSLCALAWHARRIDDRSRPGAWLVLGVLVALAMLTRVIGVALVAALVMRAAIEALSRQRRPRLGPLALAALPGVLALAAWAALRPEAGDGSYQRASGAMVHAWLGDPLLMVGASIDGVLAGWTASFTGDAAVGTLTRVLTWAIGALALAGLALRLRRNTLDAWYVAISLVIVCGWVFREENTRRLLYPLLPLLLFHAGEAFAALARAGVGSRRAVAGVAMGAGLIALVCAPAMVLLVRKASDREPVFEGLAPRYSDVTEYYTTLDGARSRALAARHAATLGGFEAIARETPAGARVMWMRPEYVGLVAGREGVPMFYAGGNEALARQVRESGADYLVVSRLFKTDLVGATGDALAPLRDSAAYASPVFTLVNPIAKSEDFVLLKVDRAALERLLVAR
jgi:4-amino-4-deoxy-L-arabinose transferase-like glycosyltransferase